MRSSTGTYWRGRHTWDLPNSPPLFIPLLSPHRNTDQNNITTTSVGAEERQLTVQGLSDAASYEVSHYQCAIDTLLN